MRASIIISIALMLILTFGCSNDKIVTPSDSSSGSVSFKIDKTNAPSNVVAVIAYLTRDNYETLIGTLNLLSDSTADISFQAIAAGAWHLKVDAINKDSIVIYTGESDVNVQANILTEINLTLVPTGNGTGSVYIFVTWGELQGYTWTDYKNNPVLTNSGSNYGVQGVQYPRILIDNGTYKMWYKNLESNGVGSVGYAESTDGISWTKIGEEPVLKPSGQNGTWDESYVSDGPVIKENGTYKMYYSGAVEAHQQGQIGLATSSDGIHWEKYPSPVICYGSGWEYSINSNSLVKKDSLYYMYYHGYSSSTGFREGLATSVDGIHWTKYQGNPILYATEDWEGTGTCSVSVIYESGRFEMIYMNYFDSNMGFGKATSVDGIHWMKDKNNPYFLGSNSANNWTSRPISPYLLKTDNNYRVYYNSSAYPTEIGFLTFNKF